jgi:Xaa-Pro aminopeptidase
VGQEHGERLRRAGEATGRAELAALLVTPSADLRYLTGYDPPPLERLTCLVIRPGRDPVLVVPELERPLAETRVGRHVGEVASWAETEDPYAVVDRLLGRGRRVACSDRMWASHLLALQRAIPDLEAIPASRVLEPLRAVKDQHEMALLERAARATDEAFRRLVEERLEGRTERQVADRLSELMLELGLERVTFTIVGSGPNGASPHHTPTDRALRHGDAVVLDFGGMVGGYCSDLSRTVVVGEPSPGLDEVHEIVREAQQRAVEAVAPGVPAEEVDRAAREVIERAGYGDRFIHRTGHGIGLEEHEGPYIVEGNRQELRSGMCFSVEPGVYLPRRFGVRIEDIVTVTDEGVARLNHAPRALHAVR